MYIYIQHIQIGVCITDSKLNTRPMQELKRYLQRKGYVLFWLTDSYRKTRKVEDWPIFDVLLSFFSVGIDFFQIKAYVDLRRPFEVNTIDKQFLLMDRRVVLSVLDRIGVPTAERLLFNNIGSSGDMYGGSGSVKIGSSGGGGNKIGSSGNIGSSDIGSGNISSSNKISSSSGDISSSGNDNISSSSNKISSSSGDISSSGNDNISSSGNKISSGSNISSTSNISTGNKICDNKVVGAKRESEYALPGVPMVDDLLFSLVVTEMKKLRVSLDIFKANRDRKMAGDCLVIDGVSIEKPYVEKPIYSENHRISIYYGSNDGERRNGVCQLFRKVGLRSSEFIPPPANGEVSGFRNDGQSYIYEKYLRMQDFLDIKAYTVGKRVYAETRKSPVKDGIVVRNRLGKEERTFIKLTPEEIRAVQRTSQAFGQFICGMDLLRTVDGQFFVVDVNGWSFVKTNPRYYKQSTLKELDKLIKKKVLKPRAKQGDISRKSDQKILSSFLSNFKSEQIDIQGVHTIYRHGSRTPKMKKRLLFVSESLSQYIQGTSHQAGRDVTRIQEVERILSQPDSLEENIAPLQALRAITQTNNDVRVKFYPLPNHHVKVILKWGGSLTAQSRKEIEYEAIEFDAFLTAMLGDTNVLTCPQACPQKERSTTRTARQVKIWANTEARTLQTAEGFHTVLQWTGRTAATTSIAEKCFSSASLDNEEAPVPAAIALAYEALKEVFVHCADGYLDMQASPVPDDSTAYYERLTILKSVHENCMCPATSSKECMCKEFCFLSRWCFMFNEHWTLTEKNIKRVTSLVSDFVSYDILQNVNSTLITTFLNQIKPHYTILDRYTKDLYLSKLNIALQDPASLEIVSFLYAQLNGPTDTIFVIKRFSILLLLNHLLAVINTHPELCQVNDQLKSDLENHIHDIGFLFSLSFVHLSYQQTDYLLVWCSPGISPSFDPIITPKPNQPRRAQRWRPLALIPAATLFARL
ncbi:inositol-hexakisphosphate/diphosphoinositol-pentakisphosphate 1-kinase [Nematocida homosporus]|uniref:inositol-hexakisphosphate/diphosphoinositol- pentakisphosphate 1-kinase n=1 Tax=Nematocida homosporus TaxID=1912981 RepID=UPI0022203CEF|nr:inositol-hexakisphosphate/diphosphoinositol-pentakisphosphate 1-kinase [Nematocida homosporus]KAI5185981.1 inositol-hexakisphosphate/diphosphoinositol-pentakisphosphate 1-kinase [Nematocida homosporus]